MDSNHHVQCGDEVLLGNSLGITLELGEGHFRLIQS